LATAVIAVVLVAGVSAAGPRRARAPVSQVVYPTQELPLRFSHAEHLRRDRVDCATCHARAASSRSSLDDLVPGERACDPCHEIDRPMSSSPRSGPGGRAGKTACRACHLDYDRATGMVARVRIPPPNIKFGHAAHAAAGVRCPTCHGDLLAENVGLATRAQLPRMSLCLSCHDGRQASRKCITCHLAGPGGIVRTELPEGKLVPSGALRGADHDSAFRLDHRATAQEDSRYCAACHRREFCIECHNGVIKPMDFHGNDYTSLHAIDARRNRPDCSACHRLQTFCVGCHSRSGISDDRARASYVPSPDGIATRMFHPRGWVESAHGGLARGEQSRAAEHHSYQAQRNIRQCASCHRDEYCKRCHTAESGFRVSPHPRSWRGSRRCEALAARNGRLCLRCHVDMVEADCNYVAAP